VANQAVDIEIVREAAKAKLLGPSELLVANDTSNCFGICDAAQDQDGQVLADNPILVRRRELELLEAIAMSVKLGVVSGERVRRIIANPL
jgi:hypothetical protein